MHAIAVFHHSVVSEFCSTESKLIKHGCIILVLVLEVSLGTKDTEMRESAKVRAAEQAQLVTCQEKVTDKVERRENEIPKPNKCWVSLLHRADSVTVQV